jgi:hypothetical protein
VLAAGLQPIHDHQIGVGKEPRLGINRFGDAGKRAEMLVAGQSAQMLPANARQLGDFFLGKEFLAGFDSDHFRPLNPDAKRILHLA